MESEKQCGSDKDNLLLRALVGLPISWARSSAAGSSSLGIVPILRGEAHVLDAVILTCLPRGVSSRSKRRLHRPWGICHWSHRGGRTQRDPFIDAVQVPAWNWEGYWLNQSWWQVVPFFQWLTSQLLVPAKLRLTTLAWKSSMESRLGSGFPMGRRSYPQARAMEGQWD